jgi:hypothetical protein
MSVSFLNALLSALALYLAFFVSCVSNSLLARRASTASLILIGANGIWMREYLLGGLIAGFALWIYGILITRMLLQLIRKCRFSPDRGYD